MIDQAPVRDSSSANDFQMLQNLRAEIMRPLIGTEAFTEIALARHADAAGTVVSAAGMRQHQRLVAGIRQMMSDPFASHSVVSIAKAAGMSRSSFAQAFSRTFGQSPLDFLKTERLRFAAHLVCTTSLPVKTIAARVGYSSASYFSRAFDAAFGIPPSALRDVIRRDDNDSTTKPPGSFAFSDSANAESRDGANDAAAYDRLRLLCDTTIDVVWDIDLLTGQVQWSEGMLHAFGYGPDQIGPDTTWCHDHIHPDDRKRVVESMNAACNNGSVFWQSYFRYLKADGSYAFVADRGAIIRDTSGKAVRFVGTMHDITVAFDEHSKTFTPARFRSGIAVSALVAQIASRPPTDRNSSEAPGEMGFANEAGPDDGQT